MIEALKVPHQISLTETRRGDNVILICKTFKSEMQLFYVYKMTFGDKIQTVVQGSFNALKLKGQFENSRFDAKKVGDVYFLEIKNVSKEDEATYLCQGGAAYAMDFFNVTFLAVNGKTYLFCSV